LSPWRLEELIGFTELLELDCFVSLAMTLDEDFSFSLLDESCSIEDDDSTPGSSFGSADAEELSSHPTTANDKISMDPIALRLQDDRPRNFFIKAPNNVYPMQM